jgi:hypothetical protein
MSTVVVVCDHLAMANDASTSSSQRNKSEQLTMEKIQQQRLVTENSEEFKILSPHIIIYP